MLNNETIRHMTHDIGSTWHVMSDPECLTCDTKNHDICHTSCDVWYTIATRDAWPTTYELMYMLCDVRHMDAWYGTHDTRRMTCGCRPPIRKGALLHSGSCRCAIIGVPWCLRRLRLFSTLWNMLLTNTSPRAKHAETDPRHGTPTMAHFQTPDIINIIN